LHTVRGNKPMHLNLSMGKGGIWQRHFRTSRNPSGQ
jgi:hypothetical protein